MGSFAVRVRPDEEIEVTVSEGRVALAPSEKARAGGRIAAPAAQLSAGESALFKDRVEKVEQISEGEMQRKLAWRQGVLAYANDSLADVVADISRYTDLDIEIADPVIAEVEIYGRFRIGETEALFETLEQNFGLSVERAGAGHVLIRSAV